MAFLPSQPNANISCVKHRDVVASIANGERHAAGVQRLDEADDSSLVPGRRSAAQYCLGRLRHIEKSAASLVSYLVGSVIEDDIKRAALNDETLLRPFVVRGGVLLLHEQRAEDFVNDFCVPHVHKLRHLHATPS